eukprot:COSAG01_NODE_401_length_17529_cov_47.865806_4_plen_112_part_00
MNNATLANASTDTKWNFVAPTASFRDHTMLLNGTRPMDNVLLGFCLTLAFAVARTHAPNVRFYAWFKDCGLEISKHRGYGQTACKAFGAAVAVARTPCRPCLCSAQSALPI